MGIKIKKLFLKDFERFVDFAVEFGSSVTRLIVLKECGIKEIIPECEY